MASEGLAVDWVLREIELIIKREWKRMLICDSSLFGDISYLEWMQYHSKKKRRKGISVYFIGRY